MKLKSYFAATVEGAMNLARLELGDDAMLVSTKRTGDDTSHLGEYEVVFATTAYPDVRGAVPTAQHQLTAAKARPIDKLSEDVASLKHDMERLAAALSRSTAGIASIAANPPLADAFSKLVAAEVDAAIAQDLLARVISQLENHGVMSASVCRRLIAAELSRLISTDSRLPTSTERNAIALVGPPGSGKTTTLVKLAVLYGLRTRRPSQILSLDCHRIAATEPLRSYASITGLGFRELETPRSLTQALEEYRSKDLVLIDTPGVSWSDFDDAAEMARLLARHPSIETHLVLSASMKPADMQRIAKQYEIFAPTKLIFTHLDETQTYGPLATLSVRTGKPISFLSRGPEIPEDLEAATTQCVVDLALNEMQAEPDELMSMAVA